MSHSLLPHSPKQLLIVCPQRIGDVLLATPLAHSLKQHWPECAIDFLVFPGCAGILEGNPDIRHVFSFRQRPTWRERWQQLAQIWRRYDLAFATVPTDRARLFAWAASRFSLGYGPEKGSRGKIHRLLRISLTFDDLNTHAVETGLALARTLGIPAIPQVCPPRIPAPAVKELFERLNLDPKSPYVILHPNPKFRYKMWREDGWSRLASDLDAQGIRVLLTGSPDPDEQTYVRQIAQACPASILNLAGQLSFAETASLLKHAQGYFGPDTAMTHLAAACNTPTTALFGPSNPVRWGPWPNGYIGSSSPWNRQGNQNARNVHLIQGPGDCVPCMKEGCDRHVGSESRCLQGLELPVTAIPRGCARQ